MTTATASTYRFVKIKVHPRIPDLFGWYLVITKDDINLFFDTHRHTAQSMFMKFHRDPHLYDQKTWKPVGDMADFYNPVRLSAGWLETAEKAMGQYGVIYVNPAGGMIYGTVEIVDEIENERLVFPTPPDPDLLITISRWGDGRHFYLSSKQRPVLSEQNKFNTIKEAHDEACRHALPANITVKDTGKFTYTREGD